MKTRSITDTIERCSLKAIMSLPAEQVLKLFRQNPVHLNNQKLHPEMQLYLLMRKIKKKAAMGELPPEESRLGYVYDSLVHGIDVPDVTSEDLVIVEGVTARLHRPRNSTDDLPLIVYYHGGGFVIGDVDMFDHVCRYMTKETGFAVLSVNYRKAPEYPFPTGIEDSIKAYQWAVKNSDKLNVDVAKFIVAGDSAGGNISTIVTQEIKTNKPLLQLLFYPTCDMTREYESGELFGEGFFLTKKDFIYFTGHYLGDPEKCDLTHPRISPIHGELKDLPPAIIVTAGFDPLRDQGEAYAHKLKGAGVNVELIREEGMIHGFINLIGFSRHSRHLFKKTLELVTSRVKNS